MAVRYKLYLNTKTNCKLVRKIVYLYGRVLGRHDHVFVTRMVEPKGVVIRGQSSVQ